MIFPSSLSKRRVPIARNNHAAGVVRSQPSNRVSVPAGARKRNPVSVLHTHDSRNPHADPASSREPNHFDGINAVRAVRFDRTRNDVPRGWLTHELDFPPVRDQVGYLVDKKGQPEQSIGESETPSGGMISSGRRNLPSSWHSAGQSRLPSNSCRSDMQVKLATWNVRSFAAEGRQTEVLDILEGLNLDVMLMTETHMPESFGKHYEKYCLMITGSGGGTSSHTGVGIIAKWSFLNGCVDHSFHERSNRVASLLCKFERRSVLLVVGYAPTEASQKEQQYAAFLKDIQSELQLADPNKDLIIVGGDFNCRIGPPRDGGLANVTGIHGCAEKTSPFGEALIMMCIESKLRIENFFLKKKMIHKHTWYHAATGKGSTLDYFLCNRPGAVTDVRARRDLMGGSDHAPVICNLTLKNSGKRAHHLGPSLKKKEQRVLIERDWSTAFEGALANHPMMTVPGWKHTETALLETINKVCPDAHPPSQNWFDDARKELEPLLTEMRAAASQWTRNPSMLRYRVRLSTLRREYREAVKLAKKSRVEKLIQEVEVASRERNSRRVKVLLNEVCGIIREPVVWSNLKNSGSPQEDELYAQHLQKVYEWKDVNLTGLKFPQAVRGIKVVSGPPSRTEIVDAIKSLKNNKAGGANGIVAETIKAAGTTLAAKLVEDFKAIWPSNDDDMVTLPESWKRAKVIKLYKGKGSRKDPNSYRGISLLDLSSKILSSIIFKRLQPLAEDYLNENQFGFRPERSTTHSIFVVKQAQQAARESNLPLLAVFIDLEKAFDSVPRECIWALLRALGAPNDVVNVTQALHTGTSGTVGKSRFKVGRGVKQGCVLGPLLFNLIFQFIVNNAMLTDGVVMTSGRTKVNLVHTEYADDLALLAENCTQAQWLLARLEKVCEQLHIRISVSKTKYMWLSSTNGDDTLDTGLSVRGEPLERVANFTYLGQQLDVSGSVKEEVKVRVRKAFGKLTSIYKILRSNQMTLAHKVTLLKVYVFSGLFYACETWNTNAKDEARLESFLNICRRAVGGVSKLDHVSNDELNAMVFLEPVRFTLCRRRIPFFADLQRPDAPALAKAAIYFRIANRNACSRTQQRWIKRVHCDLSYIQVLCESLAAGSKILDPESVNLFERSYIGGLVDISEVDRIRQVFGLMALELTPERFADRKAKAVRLNVIREKSFRCPIKDCYRVFARSRDLNGHLKSDHDPLSIKAGRVYAYPCPFNNCLQGYVRKGQLDLHLAKCHTPPTRDNLINEALPTAPLQGVQCDICSATFISLRGMKVHRTNMHVKRNSATANGPFFVPADRGLILRQESEKHMQRRMLGLEKR